VELLFQKPGELDERHSLGFGSQASDLRMDRISSVTPRSKHVAGISGARRNRAVVPFSHKAGRLADQT
jgi:hypothetical protein